MKDRIDTHTLGTPIKINKNGKIIVNYNCNCEL